MDPSIAQTIKYQSKGISNCKPRDNTRQSVTNQVIGLKWLLTST